MQSISTSRSTHLKNGNVGAFSTDINGIKVFLQPSCVIGNIQYIFVTLFDAFEPTIFLLTVCT